MTRESVTAVIRLGWLSLVNYLMEKELRIFSLSFNIVY